MKSAVARYGSIDGTVDESDKEDSYDSSPQGPQQQEKNKKAPCPAFLSSKASLVLIATMAALVWYFGFAQASSSGSGSLGYESDKPLFYEEQLVDHNDPDNSDYYSQRYFENSRYFKGAGHPIFVIMGGEDPVEKILYPFISENLAKKFHAYTICIEHRFYGESYPLSKPTNQDLKQLLTPSQALADAIRLIQSLQKRFGCGGRGSREYCPVMTVGASYPGFLAALLRIHYPDIVDIGYASSSPLHLYSHTAPVNAYFEKVSEVAEAVSPGCRKAVKQSLLDSREDILTDGHSIKYRASKYGICTDNIPSYITTAEVFADEVISVVVAHFAENNMEFYPPSQDQEFVLGCKIFQDKASASSADRLSAFLRMRKGFKKCFDLNSELPPGPNGTISAADWSGVGDGPEGRMWDFQSCTLVPECGISEHTMFPPRPFSLEWLTKHCEARFNYTPQPYHLVDTFGFENLSNATRLLFTNGLRDGWSAASILQSPSPDIKVINMENGAHHSDLTHGGPSKKDTEDVKQAHVEITNIVETWLTEIFNPWTMM